MPANAARRVLTVNGGSSSIKFAIFDAGDPPRRIRGGTVERVQSSDMAVEQLGDLAGVTAVGHRVVHGGPNHFDPCRVTPELLADLRAAVPLDPNHLPAEIRLIEAVAARLPGVPQFACFDTAFHKDLPRVAAQLPIPRRYEAAGVRRYGFHGLSFAYLMGELARLGAAGGRVILAHLGSGASLAAVRDGRCIDTTMGLTPAGGLMMGTRTGDIDPGVLIHLLRTETLSADDLDRLVNRESGLLGVSETSSDMRDLLANQAADPRAAEAVEMFCYSVRKGIGALAAALGGLDTLVFSGGIGENCPDVRDRICDGLGFLGNVSIRVIPTDEEVMIARTVFGMMDTK